MQQQNIPNSTELVQRWQDQGLNAHSLSRELGFSWRTVRAIETGARKTHRAVLLAIDAHLKARASADPRA